MAMLTKLSTSAKSRGWRRGVSVPFKEKSGSYRMQA
jgi:hypothetical protein